MPQTCSPKFFTSTAPICSPISARLANRRGFLWIKRRSPRGIAAPPRLELDWIQMERESQRHYPKGELAAHLLGAVDFEEKGTAGIEKALEADLRGQPGQMRLLTDVKRRGIDSQLATEPSPGHLLTLTIDERMQFVAEQRIGGRGQIAQGAVSGSVVVMNPHTGDILALASYPTYDPNVRPARAHESPIARRITLFRCRLSRGRCSR